MGDPAFQIVKRLKEYVGVTVSQGRLDRLVVALRTRKKNEVKRL